MPSRRHQASEPFLGPFEIWMAMALSLGALPDGEVPTIVPYAASLPTSSVK